MYVFLPCTVSLQPPTIIPILNDPLVDFLNCTHDVIQVEQKHTACHKKNTHVYYFGLGQSCFFDGQAKKVLRKVAAIETLSR